MKKMNKLTVAAAALAALALTSTVASAQNVSVGTQDLILGFQLPTGLGSYGPTDLEVDLGSFSQFNSAAPGSVIDLSSKLSATDLSSITSNWASTITWSVAGITSNDGSNSFDATSTSSTAPRTSNQAGLSQPWGVISNLSGGLNGQPKASTPNSALIGTAQSTAGNNPSSYTSLEAGTGFGFSNLGAAAEQTGAGSNELYSFTPQNAVVVHGHNTYPAATDLGTFTLSNTGGFTFTAVGQAAPEPSAYALGLCAALLFVVLRRRQSVE